MSSTPSLARFSPSGKRYAAVFRRNTFKVFDVKSATVEHSHADQKGEVYTSCEWFCLGGTAPSSKDGTTADDAAASREILVLGCRSGNVQIWDVTFRVELIGVCAEFASDSSAGTNVVAMACHPARGSLFLGRNSGSIVEINIDAPKKIVSRIGFKGAVLGLACSTDKVAAAGDAGSKLRVFNVSDGVQVFKASATLHACSSLAFLGGGAKLAVADGSDCVTM